MTTRGGVQLAPDLELLLVDIGREAIKWGDGFVLERRVLAPGQKFPDVKKLNEDTPKSDWRNGPGGLQGPWQAQRLVRLLDPKTMDRYTFATSTIGGNIAVRVLVDKTKDVRTFRGENVFPITTLSDTFMPTGFGGRQRPHFVIKRWVAFGGGGLPQAEAPALEDEINDKIQY